MVRQKKSGKGFVKRLKMTTFAPNFAIAGKTCGACYIAHYLTF